MGIQVDCLFSGLVRLEPHESIVDLREYAVGNRFLFDVKTWREEEAPELHRV